MNNPLVPKKLLEKYLNGQCTVEEKRIVEDWYYELGQNNSQADSIPQFDTAALFGKIQSQINEYEDQDSVVLLSTWKKYRVVFLSAAALLILAISITVFFTFNAAIVNTQMAQTDRVLLKNITYSIERKSLPDGSTVWLNPGASLEYNRFENSSARSVQFSGEAFFEVAKDSLHPFIIRTGDMETLVVGTSFNVLALPDSKSFKVSVVTGKVQVRVKNEKGILQSLLLLPKQQSNFNLQSKELVYNDVSEKELKTEYWKPFTLNFEDADMNEVKAELEKAFNINIEFSNSSLSKCRIRVNFNNHKLPQIIEILEKLLDVSCQMDEQNTLTIAGEGCS